MTSQAEEVGSKPRAHLRVGIFRNSWAKLHLKFTTRFKNLPFSGVCEVPNPHSARVETRAQAFSYCMELYAQQWEDDDDTKIMNSLKSVTPFFLKRRKKPTRILIFQA